MCDMCSAILQVSTSRNDNFCEYMLMGGGGGGGSENSFSEYLTSFKSPIHLSTPIYIVNTNRCRTA